MNFLLRVCIICVLVMSAGMESTIFAITQDPLPLEKLKESSGLIYGGAQGSIWKEINQHLLVLNKLDDNAWKAQVQKIIDSLNKRIGLRMEEKANILFELISRRIFSLPPIELYTLIYKNFYKINTAARVPILTATKLGYVILADYLKFLSRYTQPLKKIAY